MRVLLGIFAMLLCAASVLAADENTDAERSLFIPACKFSSRKDFGDHAWTKVLSQRKDIPDCILAAPSANKVFDINTRHFEKTTPSVSYKVVFPEAGKYYLWINGQGEAGGASVAVGLDGALTRSTAVGWFPGSYGWLGSYKEGAGQIELDVKKSGAHMVQLYMVEDGTRIAMLAISTDPSFNPATKDVPKAK